MTTPHADVLLLGDLSLAAALIAAEALDRGAALYTPVAGIGGGAGPYTPTLGNLRAALVAVPPDMAEPMSVAGFRFQGVDWSWPTNPAPMLYLAPDGDDAHAGTHPGAPLRTYGELLRRIGGGWSDVYFTEGAYELPLGPLCTARLPGVSCPDPPPQPPRAERRAARKDRR